MKILLIFTAFILVAIGAYYGGNHVGYSKGEDAGYSRGHANGLAESTATSGAYESYLRDKYNSLVDDYSVLRDTVIRYVGSTQYQPRQSLNCTSSNYGSSTTYTRCY